MVLPGLLANAKDGSSAAVFLIACPTPSGLIAGQMAMSTIIIPATVSASRAICEA